MRMSGCGLEVGGESHAARGGQSLEDHRAKVLGGVEMQRLGGLEDRVKGRRHFGASARARAVEVLPSYDRPSNRPFGAVTPRPELCRGGSCATRPPCRERHCLHLSALRNAA